MLFLLIIILCLVLQLILPWWIIGPVSFGSAAWQARSAGQAFGAGFSAVFVLWLVTGLIRSLPNQNILANRIGQMFMLPDLSFNWIIVLLITGLIGGIAAGFSALAGYYFKQLAAKPKTT